MSVHHNIQHKTKGMLVVLNLLFSVTSFAYWGAYPVEKRSINELICGTYKMNKENKCHFPRNDISDDANPPKVCFEFEFLGNKYFEFLELPSNDPVTTLIEKEVCLEGVLFVRFPLSDYTYPGQSFFLARPHREYDGATITKYPEFNNYQVNNKELYVKNYDIHIKEEIDCGRSYCQSKGMKKSIDIVLHVEETKLDAPIAGVAAAYDVLDKHHNRHAVAMFPYLPFPSNNRRIHKIDEATYMINFHQNEMGEKDLLFSLYVQTTKGTRYWLTPDNIPFAQFSLKSLLDLK